MRESEMSAHDARTFQRGASVASAVAVKAALSCDCQPYESVFTYKRWQALGFQVQRGEKAIRVPLVVEREVTDRVTGESRQVRMLRRSSLFCRCQVQPREGNGCAS